MYLSALTLLVAGILANDADDALAAHDLALVTDFFDARTDLHRCLYLCLYVILPRLGS